MAAKKKGPGRPPLIETLITERTEDGTQKITRWEAIVRAIRAGAYQRDAARHAGISEDTLYNWLSRGEEHNIPDSEDLSSIPERERPYVEFFRAVEKARGDAVVWNISIIRKAAQEGVWTAAAWWLERTHPDQYAKRERRELVGEGGGPITLLDLEREVMEAASEDD